MASVDPFAVLYYATPGGAGYPEANIRAQFAVSDIMNSAPLEWASSNDSCTSAAKRMLERNVGILPVKDPGTNFLIGVITDRDLIIRVASKALNMDNTPVALAMSGPVVAMVYDDADIAAAERLMIDRGVRRLMVIRRGDSAVVGIVSVDDFAMAGFRRRAGEILRAAAPGIAPIGSLESRKSIGTATQPSVNAPEVSYSVYTVSDVMTGLPECVRASDTCRDAAIKMTARSVGCLAVCSDEQPQSHLCGVITDRDIVIRVLARGLPPENVKVGDVMSKEVFACYSDHNLADAERIMIEKTVRRLPVLARDTGQLIGMLSVDDIALAASRSRAGRVIENAAQFPNIDDRKQDASSVTAQPESALAALKTEDAAGTS
jgi:CBS domain-containing protein